VALTADTDLDTLMRALIGGAESSGPGADGRHEQTGTVEAQLADVLSEVGLSATAAGARGQREAGRADAALESGTTASTSLPEEATAEEETRRWFRLFRGGGSKTPEPEPPAADVVPRATEESRAGAASGFALSRFDRFICGLRGHDHVLSFERDRIFLKCISCGHESTGWGWSDRRPAMRGDRISRTPAVAHRAQVRRMPWGGSHMKVVVSHGYSRPRRVTAAEPAADPAAD
jgi:hypothetical protein